MELENGSVIETAEAAQEVAAPAENTVTEDSPAEQGEEAGDADQPAEEPAEAQIPDSVWAAARKRAEAEAAKKIRASIAARDAAFAKTFAGQKHPETGKPITNEQEYLDAVAAARRIRAQKAQEAAVAKLKQSGIDPSVLEEAINNAPAIQKANEILAENQRLEQQQKEAQLTTKLEGQWKALQALDPSIQKPEDLDAIPEAEVFQGLVKAGIPLDVAYKSACFDRLATKIAAAEKQSAINAVKSKQHLTTSADGAGGKTVSEIPASELRVWKEAFPDETTAQLRARYNKTL